MLFAILEFVAQAQQLLTLNESGLIEIGEAPPLASYGIDFAL